MKMFLSLVILSITLVSFADTGETEAAGTCYRQQLVGLRNVCLPNAYDNYVAGRRWGTRYPGRYTFRSTCHQEPVYRKVPYTCPRTVRTPVEVVDGVTLEN